GIDIIKQQNGADPGAVAFDAAEAAIARKVDVLIVDTAGRLHTKTNLMNELGKIKNVLNRKIPGAPHETLLVLDATTGQNGIVQAKVFNEATPLTGIFLAKLDGMAKGGIVVAIKKQLNLPVKFIGIGEKMDDIEVFESEKFVSALFD
ncbi:MAG: signal recognition particle-docking protein FtsY, partial [Planctomycetota bacterium]